MTNQKNTEISHTAPTPSNTAGAIVKAKGTKPAAPDPGKTMRAYIAKMEGAIAKALPSVLTPERFTRIVTSALSSTPKLAETSPQSFLAAMMNAAQLGLEPNTPLGQAYLIPYNNHNRLECQFQIGYKGLIDLAYRSGEVSIVQAHEVRENDDFSYSFGLEPTLHHIPARGDRGDVVLYYAMFRTKGGGFGFEVMSREDIEAHAQRYAQSYNSSFSPWKTNFDEMAKKTVLKKALKYAPMRSDFARAISSDETIKADIAQDMADVVPVAVEYTYTVDGETGEVIEPSGTLAGGG